MQFLEKLPISTGCWYKRSIIPPRIARLFDYGQTRPVVAAFSYPLKNPNGIARWYCAILLCGFVQQSTRAADPPVSFANDVMAVLSKSGCNMGACHGNQNGKGGFKLSLRGEDPAFDYLALTRDQHGRRIDLADPDASLCLKKPIQQIAHEGGKRFSQDSLEYNLLRNWIAAGAPLDPPSTPQLVSLEVQPTEQILIAPQHELQLTAWATFSDGSRRDVTRLAVYETSSTAATVSPAGVVERVRDGESTVLVRYLNQQMPVRLAFISGSEFAWQGPAEVNLVDKLVFAKLQTLHINPAPLANDSSFVRRAYLDALGILPTAREAREFAADPSGDKRARLIDALLERREFSTHWALKWADLLHGEEKTLDRKGVQALHHWLEQSFVDHKPLDRLAREVLTARGSTYENPPANFYRASREPLARAESIAQVFLGIRLQCARCHNHPFDRWTQDDYYDWAAVFCRIDYKILANNRKDSNDKHEFDGEQIVFTAPKGKIENPRTGKSAPPRFLGEQLALAKSDGDRLEAVARWATDDRNTFFARAQANRIWYHLLGRGIVEPVDDFRGTNPPANAALLAALAAEFVEHDYDLRHLVRLVMNSSVYQLDCGADDSNETAITNFAQTTPRRLAAEPLIDAISQVLDMPAQFNGYPAGLRAGEIPGVQAIRPREARPSDADRFLTLFGKPPRLLTCECERMQETTLGQAFQLVSGPLVNSLLIAPDNHLGQCLNSNKEPDEIVDDLFWSALSRAPTAAERQAIVARLTSAADRRLVLEDIAWSVLNSREFLLRH